jgi:hypothetical protein
MPIRAISQRKQKDLIIVKKVKVLMDLSLFLKILKFVFVRGLLNLKIEFVVKILNIRLFLFDCKKEIKKSYLVNLLKFDVIILKLCLVKVGEMRGNFVKSPLVKLDLFLKRLLTVLVTVPVTVPFTKLKILIKALIINVVIKSIKL